MSMQPLNAISRARFVAGVIIAALTLTPSLAHAASATWSGATSGNWSVTTNWSANPVPGTGDTATRRHSTPQAPTQCSISARA